MGIYTKRFSWLPTRSAWEEAQLWRERRAAALGSHTTFLPLLNATLTGRG